MEVRVQVKELNAICLLNNTDYSIFPPGKYCATKSIVVQNWERLPIVLFREEILFPMT